MLSPQSDLVEYQAGAFFTEAEAKKILDVLRGERRSEPMVINMVPVFRTAEEWHENR